MVGRSGTAEVSLHHAINAREPTVLRKWNVDQ